MADDLPRNAVSKSPWIPAEPSGIRMPTFAKPADCTCSWSVVKRGVGMECISELRQRHAACRHRHERVSAA